VVFRGQTFNHGDTDLNTSLRSLYGRGTQGPRDPRQCFGGGECWLESSESSSELVSRSMLLLDVGISRLVPETVPSCSGPRSALGSESEESKSNVRLNSERDPEIAEELSESVSTWWLMLMGCCRAVQSHLR